MLGFQGQSSLIGLQSIICLLRDSVEFTRYEISLRVIGLAGQDSVYSVLGDIQLIAKHCNSRQSEMGFGQVAS